MGSEEIDVDRASSSPVKPSSSSIDWSSAGSAVLRGVQDRVPTVPRAPTSLERAVATAAAADTAVVVVGTNDDWESEGHDRETMDLPGDQDELDRAAWSPRTRTPSSS